MFFSFFSFFFPPYLADFDSNISMQFLPAVTEALWQLI